MYMILQSKLHTELTMNSNLSVRNILLRVNICSVLFAILYRALWAPPCCKSIGKLESVQKMATNSQERTDL